MLHILLLYACCSFDSDKPGMTDNVADTIRTITQSIAFLAAGPMRRRESVHSEE